jgi:dihydrofolate reductase
MLSIIAVIGKNRELGRNNKLLWHIPGDLPRFKQITSGHPVIMGRKTFQSIGRPLSGRANFVITADPAFTADGVTIVSSLDVAIKQAQNAPGAEEIFVIGGGSTYAQAIDLADRLYLTVVNAEAKDADTFFPEYGQFKKVITQEDQQKEGYRFSYIILER